MSFSVCFAASEGVAKDFRDSLWDPPNLPYCTTCDFPLSFICQRLREDPSSKKNLLKSDMISLSASLDATVFWTPLAIPETGIIASFGPLRGPPHSDKS